MNNIGWIAGVILLLSSCIDPRTVYHQQQSIGSQGWNSQDTLSFTIDSLTPGQPYQLRLEGRLTKTYPYQKLLIGLILDNQTQALVIPIYEEGSTENTWKGEVPFYQPFQSEAVRYTPSQATGHIQFFHNMGEKAIEGVCEIGIRMER